MLILRLDRFIIVNLHSLKPIHIAIPLACLLFDLYHYVLFLYMVVNYFDLILVLRCCFQCIYSLTFTHKHSPWSVFSVLFWPVGTPQVGFYLTKYHRFAKVWIYRSMVDTICLVAMHFIQCLKGCYGTLVSVQLHKVYRELWLSIYRIISTTQVASMYVQLFTILLVPGMSNTMSYPYVAHHFHLHIAGAIRVCQYRHFTLAAYPLDPYYYGWIMLLCSYQQ